MGEEPVAIGLREWIAGFLGTSFAVRRHLAEVTCSTMEGPIGRMYFV
jgi:hypothetical protein